MNVNKELSPEELGDLERFGLLVEEFLLGDFDVLSDWIWYVFEVLDSRHAVSGDFKVRSRESFGTGAKRGNTVRVDKILLADQKGVTYYFLVEPSKTTQRYFLSFSRTLAMTHSFSAFWTSM